jgi:hypothetical protein
MHDKAIRQNFEVVKEGRILHFVSGYIRFVVNNLKSKKRQSDKLQFFGVLLFFLGFVVGLFVPMMANPRMGLSSHLEGVLNGIFLIVLGLIWNQLEISIRWLNFTYWLSLPIINIPSKLS